MQTIGSFSYALLVCLEKINIKDFTYPIPTKWQINVLDSKYLVFRDFAWIEATLVKEDLMPEFTDLMAQGLYYKSNQKVGSFVLYLEEEFNASYTTGSNR